MESWKVGRYFDFCEELNFKWTSLILLIFVSVVGVLRYAFLTSLITCITPSYFKPTDVFYAHQACWNKKELIKINSFDEIIKPEEFLTSKTRHGWIPVVLSLMLIGFQIPRLFKLLMSGFIGRAVNHVQEIQKVDAAERNTNQLAEIVREATDQRRFVRTVFHFIAKLLICINLLVQFVLIGEYYRSDFSETVREGNSTFISSVKASPTTVLCDYYVMQRSNIQHYTLQCDIQANALYEKFFYVLWFWILLVGIYSSLTLFVQFLTLVVPPFVKLRFRGIISENSLSARGCSFDDALLHLMNIQDTFGQATAREVASKVWETNPKTSQSVSPTCQQGYLTVSPALQQHHDTATLIVEEKL